MVPLAPDLERFFATVPFQEVSCQLWHGSRPAPGRHDLQPNLIVRAPQAVNAALLKSSTINGETTTSCTLLLKPQAKFCT